MDHPAGQQTTTTTTPRASATLAEDAAAGLTPWESIDPDEPADGPTPDAARTAEEEPEAVAVYHATEEGHVDASIDGVGDRKSQVTSDNVTQVTADVTPIASAEITTDDTLIHAVAEQAGDAARVDAEPPIDAQALAAVLDPIVAAASVEAPTDFAADIQPCIAPTNLRDPALAESTVVADPIIATLDASSSTREANPAALLIEAISEDSTEFFGDTIDRLDAMPDSLSAIASITEVVGEQPAAASSEFGEAPVADKSVTSASAAEPALESVPSLVPVLQHVGPRFDRPRAAAPEPVANESLPDPAAIEPLESDDLAAANFINEEASSREDISIESEAELETFDDPVIADVDASNAATEFENPQTAPALDPIAQVDEEIAESVFADEDELEPDFVEARWEDPELDEDELEPVASGAGGGWTIPILCAGIGLIACCVVIPQADANRRLAYEKMTLTTDLASIQRQVTVNDEFLKKVVDDPSLAERLAQRQLKRVRKGQHVLKLREERPEMSPFQITAVTPPPAPPPYRPLPGVIASLCYSARTRLYLMGLALAMIAVGLVMGAAPMKLRTPLTAED